MCVVLFPNSTSSLHLCMSLCLYLGFHITGLLHFVKYLKLKKSCSLSWFLHHSDSYGSIESLCVLFHFCKNTLKILKIITQKLEMDMMNILTVFFLSSNMGHPLTCLILSSIYLNNDFGLSVKLLNIIYYYY